MSANTSIHKRWVSSSEKKQYSNKSWTRKAEESKERSKKELAAFIKKQVAQGVQKELASVEKKRKSSDDALDMNAMDLDSFNYTDGVADLDISEEIDVWGLGNDGSTVSTKKLAKQSKHSSNQKITNLSCMDEEESSMSPELFALDDESSCESTCSLTRSAGSIDCWSVYRSYGGITEDPLLDW